MNPKGKLRIATQKSGRLSEGSLGLLRKTGLQFETSPDGLFTSCRNLPIDILFLRDDDILSSVALDEATKIEVIA